MRKTALVIAGVLAFGLGGMVVTSHAATDAPTPEGGKTNTLTLSQHINPSSPKLLDATVSFAKFTTTYTPATCTANGGKSGVQNGVQGCVLPGKGQPAGISDQGSTGGLSSYKTH
jgi:hypothetical protein